MSSTPVTPPRPARKTLIALAAAGLATVGCAVLALGVARWVRLAGAGLIVLGLLGVLALAVRALDAHRRVSVLTAQLASANTNNAKSRGELLQLRGRLDALGEVLDRLGRQDGETRAELERTRRAGESLQQQVSTISDHLTEVTERVAALTSSVHEARPALDQAGQLVEILGPANAQLTAWYEEQQHLTDELARLARVVAGLRADAQRRDSGPGSASGSASGTA